MHRSLWLGCALCAWIWVYSPAASSERVQGQRQGLAPQEGLSLPPAKGRAPFHLELRLKQAPFRDAPQDAPHVIVHASSHFRADRPFTLVVFFHGWSGCTRVLAYLGKEARCTPSMPPAPGWGLLERHERAGLPSLLIVPQLAWRKRETKTGRFREASYLRAFLRELRDILRAETGQEIDLEAAPRSVWLAHSAGYAPLRDLLEQDTPLPGTSQDVVLFDALYEDAAVFARWLRTPGAHKRLVSFYTSDATTQAQNRALAERLRRAKVELSFEDRELESPFPCASPLVIRRSRVGHGRVALTYFSPLLRALGGCEPGET